LSRDWSSDVCSSDLLPTLQVLSIRRVPVFSLDMSDVASSICTIFVQTLQRTEINDVRLNLQLTRQKPGDVEGKPGGLVQIAFEQIGRASCREREESA